MTILLALVIAIAAARDIVTNRCGALPATVCIHEPFVNSPIPLRIGGGTSVRQSTGIFLAVDDPIATQSDPSEWQTNIENLIQRTRIRPPSDSKCNTNLDDSYGTYLVPRSFANALNDSSRVIIARFAIVSTTTTIPADKGVIGLAFNWANINDHSRFVVGTASNCSSIQTRSPSNNSTTRFTVSQPVSRGSLTVNAIYSLRVHWNETAVDASITEIPSLSGSVANLTAFARVVVPMNTSTFSARDFALYLSGHEDVQFYEFLAVNEEFEDTVLSGAFLTTGITTGSTTGITTGLATTGLATTGMTTGLTTGLATTGMTTGLTTGLATTGMTTGLTTGMTTGLTTGMTTGMTTGLTTGGMFCERPRTIPPNITSIKTLPYTQSFEVYTDFAAEGWTSIGLVAAGSGCSSWSVTDIVARNRTGRIKDCYAGRRCWVTGAKTYNSNEKSMIISPLFDFTAYTSPPILTFAINYDTEAGFDGISVQSSTNGGSVWNTIGSSSSLIWYNAGSLTALQWAKPSAEAGVGAFTGRSDGWVVRSHALTGLEGKSTVKIRFVLGTDSMTTNVSGIAIDAFSITTKALPACPLPVFPLHDAANVSATPFYLEWSSSAVTYKVSLGVTLNNHTSVLNEVATGTTLRALTPPKEPGVYYWRVTPIAIDGTASELCPTWSFTVAINPISTFPYVATFDDDWGGWHASNIGGSSVWLRGNPANFNKTWEPGVSGSALHQSCVFTQANLTKPGSYPLGQISALESPPFDFRSLPSHLISINQLFDFHFSDGVTFQVSYDRGVNWFQYGQQGTTETNAYNWFNRGLQQPITSLQAYRNKDDFNTGIHGWSGGPTPSWRLARVNYTLGVTMLPSPVLKACQGEVYFRFLFGSATDALSVGLREGFFFDDFRIELEPSGKFTPCPTPAPTPAPTPLPTPAPTPAPTPEPTPAAIVPTPSPTPKPTPSPTPAPTPAPDRCGDKIVGATEECEVGVCCDLTTCRFKRDKFVCRAAVANNACSRAEACDGTASTCPADESMPAGTACDDGISTTTDDKCTADGICRGRVTSCVTNMFLCEDSNVCTDDVCSQGVCSYLPVAGNPGCDDGVACTVDDRCTGGQCVGQTHCASPCQNHGVCCVDKCVCNGDFVGRACEALSDPTCAGAPALGAGVVKTTGRKVSLTLGANSLSMGQVRCSVAKLLRVPLARIVVSFNQKRATSIDVTVLDFDPDGNGPLPVDPSTPLAQEFVDVVSSPDDAPLANVGLGALRTASTPIDATVTTTTVTPATTTATTATEPGTVSGTPGSDSVTTSPSESNGTPGSTAPGTSVSQSSAPLVTPEESDGLADWEIALIAIACILVYLAAVIGIVFFLRKKRAAGDAPPPKAAQNSGTEMRDAPKSTPTPAADPNRPVVTFINPDDDETSGSYETESEAPPATTSKTSSKAVVTKKADSSEEDDDDDDDDEVSETPPAAHAVKKNEAESSEEVEEEESYEEESEKEESKEASEKQSATPSGSGANDDDDDDDDESSTG